MRGEKPTMRKISFSLPPASRYKPDYRSSVATRSIHKLPATFSLSDFETHPGQLYFFSVFLFKLALSLTVKQDLILCPLLTVTRPKSTEKPSYSIVGLQRWKPSQTGFLLLKGFCHYNPILLRLNASSV